MSNNANDIARQIVEREKKLTKGFRTEMIENLKKASEKGWFNTLELAKSSDFWQEIGKENPVTDKTIKDFVAEKYLHLKNYSFASNWFKETYALLCAKMAEKIRDSKKATEVKDAIRDELGFCSGTLLPGNLNTNLSVTCLYLEKEPNGGSPKFFLTEKNKTKGWWIKKITSKDKEEMSELSGQNGQFFVLLACNNKKYLIWSINNGFSYSLVNDITEASESSSLDACIRLVPGSLTSSNLPFYFT